MTHDELMGAWRHDAGYPADSAMAFLLAVHLRYPVEVIDGRVTHGDPTDPGRAMLVRTEDVDDLEARGWLALDGDDERPARATDAGRYWLARWVATNWRRLGLPRPRRLDELGVRGR